jgi:hypothetical protein
LKTEFVVADMACSNAPMPKKLGLRRYKSGSRRFSRPKEAELRDVRGLSGWWTNKVVRALFL